MRTAHRCRVIVSSVLKILAMPDVCERLANLGAEIVGGSVQDSAAFLKAEIAKFAKVARETTFMRIDTGSRSRNFCSE